MKISKLLVLPLSLGVISILPSCNSSNTVKLVLKTPPLTVSNIIQTVDTYDLLKKAAEDFATQYKDKKVEISVTKFPYEKEQQYITGCFDTENATDILLEGYFNMSSYIYSGRVISLDHIMSDDVRSDFSTYDLEEGQIEGKTYMLPYYNLANTLAYNKKLFKLCGLDKYILEEGKIAHWSLSEWEEILDTLAEKLPDNISPMMMYAKDNQGDTHIMTLLRSHGCEFFDREGNFALDNEKGIQALKWIQDGVDKGWYPSHPENITVSDCTDLFEGQQLAICMTNNASFPLLNAKYPDTFGLVNFPSISGKGFSTGFITGLMVFDNNNEEKLKVAKDFIKYFYSHNDYLQYEAIGIPSNKSVMEKHKDQIYMLDAYKNNADTQVDFTANNPNWQGENGSVRTLFYKSINSLLKKELTPEKCAYKIQFECNYAIDVGRQQGKLHV